MALPKQGCRNSNIYTAYFTFAESFLRLKKASSIFILVVLIYNLWGLFILFQSLDFAAKREAHQMISDGAANVHYSVITIPASELQSQKHLFSFVDDDELFWQGSMYDVITKTVTADSITYCCIKDDDESILVSAYLRYLEQKNTTDNQQPVRNVLKNLIQPFHLPQGETNIPLTTNFYYPEHSFTFSFPFYMECLSPPPDVV